MLLGKSLFLKMSCCTRLKMEDFVLRCEKCRKLFKLRPLLKEDGLSISVLCCGKPMQWELFEWKAVLRCEKCESSMSLDIE